ncbi:MAG: hypothetical protein ACE5JX_08195 [Acidobacteriota bacterium]
MSSGLARSGLVIFFTLVFVVFYAIAYSVWLGVRDNYRRYAQKSELQWTGPPRQRLSLRSPSLLWLLTLSVLTAWMVVELFILQ